MATKNTPNEEVDLGQLFKVIGNGFKNLFNAIINLFKSLFHYFILVILFLKRYALYIGIATILGGLIGYFYNISDDDISVYESEMKVITNYGSAKRLYSQIDYVNNLISEEDSIKIAKIFDLTHNEANSLNKFLVEPIDPDENFLLDYDFYMQNTDTIFTRDFTIKDFTQRKTDTDLRNHLVKAKAKSPTIFSKLNIGFKTLVENKFYKEIHKLKKEEIAIKEKTLQKELRDIDSLRNRYNKVALLEAKKAGNTNNSNISLSTRNVKEKNFDLDLYYMNRSLLSKLERLNLEKIINNEIFTIISTFENGVEVSSIKNKLWFRFAFYGFILSILVILGLKFNKYLINYEKNI